MEQAGTLVPDERVILTLRGGEASAAQVSARVSRIGADGEVDLHVADTFAAAGATLRPGTPVALDCARPDGLWRLSSLVERVVRHGAEAGPDLSVTAPHDARRVDRRRFLRVAAHLPLRLAVLDLGEHPVFDADRPETWRGAGEAAVAAGGRDAMAFSIGAGGLAATFADPVPADAFVWLVAELQGVSLSCAGHVAWTEAAGRVRPRAGVELRGLTDAAEDALLRLVAAVRLRRHR